MGDSVIQEQQMNNNDDYDYLIKMLALGNTAVGKTSILFQYTDSSFNSKFVSTVGIDFRTKRLKHRVSPSVGDGSSSGSATEQQSKQSSDSTSTKEYNIQLQLWDTAGQERFRSLSITFLRDAMGFMLVFDISNEESFIQIRNWLSLLQMHAYCTEPDMILVGNKVDLEECRVVSRERAQALADELKIPYVETSALTGENVQEAVSQLLDMIMHRIERSVDKTRLPVRHNLGLLKLTTEEEPKKGCSC